MMHSSTSKNRTIHYYVHGRGRGHGTRTLKVTEALVAAGFSVRIFAGEDPLSMIRAAYPAEAVASLMPARPLAWPVLLRRRVRAAVDVIGRDAPLAVVSDGDLPGLLAAHRCKVPSIAVGRAEVFGETRRPQGAPLLPWFREMCSAKVSSLTATRHVAVSFVETAPRNRRTLTAAPSVAPIAKREFPDLDAVCYFRDENGDAVLDCLSSAGFKVALFSRDPSAVRPRTDVRVHPLQRGAFLDALGRTRAVVASAGSQLISECAAANIPIYALHAAADDEQRINVALIRKAGIGDGTAFETFVSEMLRRFLHTRRAAAPSRRMPAPKQRVDEVVCGLVEALAAGSPI